MVPLVKERRTLVEGRDVEQWSIGSIASVVGGEGEALVFRSEILLSELSSESSRRREGRPGPFRWHVGNVGRQRQGRQWVDVDYRLHEWVSDEYHVLHFHSALIVLAEGIHLCRAFMMNIVAVVTWAEVERP